MPAIAAGAAVAAAINAGVTSLIAAQIIYAATYVIVSAAAALAMSYIGNALFGTKPQTSGASSLASDRSQMVRQAVTSRKIIYGKVKTSGPLTFLHVSSDNRYCYLLVTLTGHPIEAIDEVWFGDEKVDLYYTDSWSSGAYATGAYVRVGTTYYQRTSAAYPTEEVWVSTGSEDSAGYYETVPVVRQSPETAPTLWAVVSDPSVISGTRQVGGDYAGYAWVCTGLGTDATDADLLAQMRADVSSLWTADHRQRGCAKIYVKLKWNSDVFTSGIPNIAVVMRGKNDIYDPRTETTGYTSNWALCVADYLTMSREEGGVGSTWADIGDDDLIASANVCDESVSLSGGGTEARYQAHGVIDTEDSPKSIIESLLTAGAGSVVWSGGKWRVFAGYYRTPESQVITDDMLVGPVRVQTRRSRSDLYNSVRGTFISPDNDWEESDLPVLKSSAFIAEDAGEAVYTDIEYAFTTSSAAGQRLMKIALLRCRQQIAVTLQCNLSAMRYRAGDNVKLTRATFGWDGKVFEVTSWTLVPRDDGTIGIDLGLQETAPSVWDWSTSEEQTVDPAPNTNLPKPWTVLPPRNLALVSGESALLINRDNSVTLRIRAAWEASITATVSAYEMQFKLSSAESWSAMPDVPADTFEGYLFPVTQGSAYDVRVRARNSLGVRSEWTTISNHVVIGLTDPPADVTMFRVSVVGDIATLTWRGVTSPDLSHYRVKHSPASSDATWGAAADVMPVASGTTVQVAAMTGTYLIKAVDQGGRESVNPALVINGTSAITKMNAVDDISAPDWDGVANNTVVVNGALHLASVDKMSDWGALSNLRNLSMGANGFVSDGTFTLSKTVDLLERYTSRITPTLDVFGRNVANVMATWGALASVERLSGSDPSQWGAGIQIATSQDAAEWADFADASLSDITARAYSARIVLSSGAQSVTPVVTSARLAIDMPDRLESGSDIECPAGGVTVVFDPPFRSLAGITFDDQEMEPGDVAIMVAKSATGFTRKYQNSSGADVSRSFDYTAVGDGRVVS